MTNKKKLKLDIQDALPKIELYKTTADNGQQVETIVLTENDGDEINYTESVKDVFYDLLGISIYEVIDNCDKEIAKITNVRLLISGIKETNEFLGAVIILTGKNVDGLFNTWQAEIEDYTNVLQEILDENFKNPSNVSSITYTDDFSNEKHIMN